MPHTLSSPKFYLFVRKTTDWSNEKTFRSQLDPKFAPKVEAWNKVFSIPYHIFRHELVAIASQNHQRLECVKTALWDEIPEGAIVLPTDDDDWFAPHIVEILRESLRNDGRNFLWDQSVLEVPINFLHGVNLAVRKFLPLGGPKWLCATNNYAFTKTASSEKLLSHMRASKAFSCGELELVKIPNRLSLHNRSLASITSMGLGRDNITSRELKRKARAYRWLYSTFNLPQDLHWASPYVKRMAELAEALTCQ
jgi:hypothetical protein